MTIEFRASFARDLKRIRNNPLLNEVRELKQLKTFARLVMSKSSELKATIYRIRLGDYRIGLIVEDTTARFVRFLHRSEIYRYFP